MGKKRRTSRDVCREVRLISGVCTRLNAAGNFWRGRMTETLANVYTAEEATPKQSSGTDDARAKQYE
jgi:hypothetical protein